MNNNQAKEKFATIISKLTPLEFITIGTIIGYVLSVDLTVDEANALGNLFEMIGQIMLTYTSKLQYSPTLEEFNDLKRKVNYLINNDKKNS